MIQKIQCILDNNNPFIHNSRSLAQSEDIQLCRLLTNEQPIDRPQYCLPTASQVAGIIVGVEEVGNMNPRGILIESTTSDLSL